MTDSNHSTKKQKLADEKDFFYLKNYSSVLTPPFLQSSRSFLCYLHKFKSAPLFGVLLPIKYPENSIIEFVDTYEVLLSALSVLQSFQHEL